MRSSCANKVHLDPHSCPLHGFGPLSKFPLGSLRDPSKGFGPLSTFHFEAPRLKMSEQASTPSLSKSIDVPSWCDLAMGRAGQTATISTFRNFKFLWKEAPSLPPCPRGAGEQDLDK